MHRKFSKFSGEESQPSMAALVRAVNGRETADVPGDDLDKLYSVMKIFPFPPVNCKEWAKRL